MFCSKKKFAPKSIPQELTKPLSFSINDTKFQMRDFSGIKSNSRNMNNDYNRLNDKIQDKLSLMKQLN
jgi:hypothetical protein